MLTKLTGRFAIIDLGSNSFHLLLGSISSEGDWKIDQQISETVRLRAGLSQQEELSWESMNRALTCLDAFSARLTKFDPDRNKVRIIGTATLRLAKNRDLFLSHASKRVGYPIEVISGEEEAALIYQAIFHYLRHAQHHVHEKILGIDVGGGSTELAVGLNQDPKKSVSLSIGCIESQIYFLGKEGLSAENFALATQHVEAQFLAAEGHIKTLLDFGWQEVYAGSGSAEMLAQVARFLAIGEGHYITRAELLHIQTQLILLKEYQHIKTLGLKDSQLSIFPGIIVIFLALMDYLKLEKIKVLPVGLRHGILAAMLSSSLQPLTHNK